MVKNVLALAILFVISNLVGAVEAPRFALIIGNAEYTGVPALKNPVNDATDIAANLADIGWNVTKVLDANKASMQRAIKKFRDQVATTKGATILFYYSGHGVQIRDKNYLIPTRFDDEPQDEEELADFSVPVDYLTDQFAEAAPKTTIIILDACRDNPFLKGKATRSVGAASRGLVAVNLKDTETQSAIIFSTAPGTTASDGTGRNGLFTEAFLKHIKEADQLTDLMNKVTADVQKATKGVQKPFTSYNMSASFYLLSETERAARVEAAKKEADAQRQAELSAALAAEREKLAQEKADLQAQLQQQLAQAQRDAEASKAQLAAERAKAQAEADAAKKTADDARRAALAAQSAYDKALASGSDADKTSAEALQKQVAATQKALADAEAAKKSTSDVLAAADTRTRQAQAEADAARKAAADAVAAADEKTKAALADAEAARKAVAEAQALNQALKDALARGTGGTARLSFTDLPVNVQNIKSGDDSLNPTWINSNYAVVDGITPDIPMTLTFYASYSSDKPNKTLQVTPTGDDTGVTISGGRFRFPWMPSDATLSLAENPIEYSLETVPGAETSDDGPRLSPKFLEGEYNVTLSWQGHSSSLISATIQPEKETTISEGLDFIGGLLEDNLRLTTAQLQKQRGQSLGGWLTLTAGTLLAAGAAGAYFYGIPIYQQYHNAATTAEADAARVQLDLLGKAWPALAGSGAAGVMLGWLMLAFNPPDDFGSEIRTLTQKLAEVHEAEAAQ